MLASLLLAAATAAATPEPAWLPDLAAAAAIFPGGGHLVLGEPGQAAIAFGATALPLVAGSLFDQPLVFADLPDQRLPLLLMTAQEAWGVQIYDAFQQGRERTGNAGFPQPLVRVSPAELVLAPFQPAQLLDPAVWGAVAQMFFIGVLLDNVLPDPDAPPTPFVFTARSASYHGVEVGPVGGFGLNAGAGAVLSWHAGVGEEALFRGVIQDGWERSTGPWGAVAVTSAIFGAAHVGGINQTSWAKQFLGPGSAGVVLGRLYQTSGYDLRKSVAAHAYYDTLSFALSALRPSTSGNNVLGVQFSF